MTLRQASSAGSGPHTSSRWRRRIWAVKPETLLLRYEAAVSWLLLSPLPFNSLWPCHDRCISLTWHWQSQIPDSHSAV